MKRLLFTLMVSSALWASDARANGLSGRWVLAQATTSVTDLPVVGEMSATTRVVAVHDLRHDGERLYGRGVLCGVDVVDDSSLVSTTIPDALRKVLPPPIIDARVGEVDGKLRLRQGRRTVVVGAKLADPVRDPLPTSPRDARVHDLDGDDKPGVTIVIGGIVSGEIYTAQRSWTALDGAAVGRNGFAGRVHFGVEQRVLGATTSMLEDPPEQRPDLERSWFRMTRIGHVGALPESCKSARAVAAKWFQ